jgi:2-C-methyl-D-erythritol 4-phosphate cytidylyltransferase / 2-C-methyl-D-erythritol 2,4-cyclodiphosphate synthase
VNDAKDSSEEAVADLIQAVVVAAGSSRRMGGVDKLQADLAGWPVLRWSLEALVAAGVERIVVATSPDSIAEVAGAAWLPDAVVAVVGGGARRQDSVAAGVVALAESEGSSGGRRPGAPRRGATPHDPVILVHDAARPLVSPMLIKAVAEAVAKYGAAIPVMPVAETLKRLDGDNIGTTIDRTNVVAAQTPQGARRSLFERAYAAYHPNGPETWTDEASLLEACRIPVHAIDGEATNLKVTVPVDLELARVMLDGGLVPDRPVSSVRLPIEQSGGLPPEPLAFGRVGLGLDGHPFGPGEPLVLGGLRIEGAPSLIGHSDGDVALHAVADALLGAAGLGDLGRLFPADSRTPVGVDSRVLLSIVAEKVRAAGWQPVNVDLTIVASRPKLAALLPAMGEAIAASLGVDPRAVSVKASTGNLGGPEGAGRSISASAITWLAPAAVAAVAAPPATDHVSSPEGVA